ncbi:MAG TPA: hypothetical protein VFV28_06670 [Limnobacter sp.]|nr:hypothetical protein [Limnobacter sp.]
MTLRAPYQVLHCTPYKQQSFEREVFFETLGACWALSARNVSGAFGMQLQLDLCRIQLLYGVPSQYLPEHLLFQFLHVFRYRPRQDGASGQAQAAHNALELIESMGEGDFLNFTTGFQDAVKQILEPLPCWTPECKQANLALKYYGLNLVESRMEQARFKRSYADLLANYLLTTQLVFKQDSRTTSYHF